jgi:hypothetical protein
MPLHAISPALKQEQPRDGVDVPQPGIGTQVLLPSHKVSRLWELHVPATHTRPEEQSSDVWQLVFAAGRHAAASIGNAKVKTEVCFMPLRFQGCLALPASSRFQSE